MAWLKSRYYPVNINARLIYNDPQVREGDCSLGSVLYRDKKTIGIKGERLNTHACYQSFKVIG